MNLEEFLYSQYLELIFMLTDLVIPIKSIFPGGTRYPPLPTRLIMMILDYSKKMMNILININYET